MSLLMWAGERFAVVLGQVGTAGHLGCTDKPRVIARDAGLGDPELLWKTEPLVSLRHGVGCSQKAGELGLPWLVHKNTGAQFNSNFEQATDNRYVPNVTRLLCFIWPPCPGMS